MEEISSGPHLDGNRIIYGGAHAAGREPLPDQLIQPEQIPLQGILDLGRRQRNIRGANGLVGVLNLGSGFPGRLRGGHIRGSVMLSDILAGRLVRLFRHPGGIGTQVGDHTHGAVPFDIHAFIKLLGDPHGLGRGEVQRLGSLLLQGTGGKRNGHLLGPLAFLYFFHIIPGVLQFFQNPVQVLLFADADLSLLISVKPGPQRLFGRPIFQKRFQIPVFFRNKRADLFLPVADHPQRYRLNPAGA